MPYGSMIEQISHNNQVLDSVNSRLDTLRELFSTIPSDSIHAKNDGFEVDTGVESRVIYQNGDVSVTEGTWKKAGDLWPEHIHKCSVEFLIVLKGKFIVTIGEIPRTMARGECASLPMGVKHSALALEDNSQILGICVPPELAYFVEDFQCPTFPKRN